MTIATIPLTERRARWRTTIAALVAVVIMLTVIAAGILGAAAPASAASYGNGGNWSQTGRWIGSYLHNGVRVYCVDSEVRFQDVAPDGTLIDHLGPHPLDDSTRSVFGDALQKLNYAISVWGQQADDYTNAAVQAYVWEITNAYGHDGTYYLSNAPEGVVSAYFHIKADVEANFDQGGGVGSGVMTVQSDAQNAHLGTLTITELSPADSVGTVALTNGVFADTGSNVREGVGNNASLPIMGVSPSDSVEYKIRAVGEFRGDGPVHYQSNLVLYGSAPDGWQRTVAAGKTSPGSVDFALEAEDVTSRSSAFVPVVATKVQSKFVQLGEELVDILTFSSAVNAAGGSTIWRQHEDGSFAVVKARATIYGPFLAQPEESDTVPTGAPIAAQGIEVETTESDGPSKKYTVRSGFSSQEAGFYTWVWEIDGNVQPESTRRFLPEGYYFRDRFGQVAESSITPSNLVITTQVTATEAGMSSLISDEVTVSVVGGGWLEVDGKPVPAVLDGTAYFSETEPSLSPQAPEEAMAIGSLKLDVNGPGAVMSGSIPMPLREGYVTFQWCLNEASQPNEYRGMLKPSCDDYGQGSETVKVVAPTVTTEAQKSAAVYDPIGDTAIVSGTVPRHTWVRFELFKRPEVGDIKRNEQGTPTEEVWNEDEISGLGEQSVCVAENRVITTEAVPVEAGPNEEARYDSPRVRVEQIGTYWWIETMYHEHPKTGERTVLRTGECGLPNETTVVEHPRVTTQAVTEVEFGEKAHDVALVEGVIPGDESGVVTELTFEVFKRVGAEPVCLEENRVHDLSTPVIVKEAGEYVSAEVLLDEPGEYYWVETLSYVREDGERVVAHVGECGLPNETTRVLGPLATTGSEAAPLALSGAAALTLGAGLMFIGAGLLRDRLRRLLPS